MTEAMDDAVHHPESLPPEAEGDASEGVSPFAQSRYRVKQEAYAGPLDKLLELVRDEKVDIFQVSLAAITGEFQAYVESMEKHNLDEIGDYLVIAGQLMVYKSKNLLPTETIDEEEEPVDEQQLLLKRLKDYEKFRQLADLLRKAEEERRLLYLREKPPPTVESREAVEFYEVNVFDLATAFKRVLEEIGESEQKVIQGEEYTIDEKMAEMQLLLLESGELCLTLYLKPMETRIEVIVTFLALLELIRLQKIAARQMAQFADIWIYRLQTIQRDSEGEVDIAYSQAEEDAETRRQQPSPAESGNPPLPDEEVPEDEISDLEPTPEEGDNLS